MSVLDRTDLQADIIRAVAEFTPLPARWYVDQDIYAFERKHLLSRCWHLLGPYRSKLTRRGDIVTSSAAGVPVVLTYDGVRISGFVNVCRHRGHAVALSDGNREDCVLTCPYHGWTYGFDGALRNSPRSEHEAFFQPSNHALTPVKIAVWGDFIFANLSSNATEFDDEYGELQKVLKARNLDIAATAFYRSIDVSIACNWKIYISNSLEAYHVPVLNPAVHETYDAFDEKFPAELYESFVYTTLTARPQNRTGPKEWATVIVPPMILISRSGSGALRIRRINPTGPEGVNVTTYYMVPEGADLAAIDREADTYAVAVGREVREACESVQRSMAALGHVAAHPGRLMAASEPGVVWLTGWIRNKLFPPATSGNGCGSP